MVDRWGEWKWLTKIILAISWGFFLFLVILAFTFNGTIISTLLCTPFLFMITLAAFLFYYLARNEEDSIRKKKAPLSGMLVYSTILLVFSWVIFVIMLVFLYPESDAEHQSNFLATCTPFMLIMTILFLLFITYELKKPWKNHLYHDPDVSYRQVNDGTADIRDATQFFEPASITDSDEARVLRKVIIGLIGLSIALVFLSLPSYSQVSGISVGSSVELMLLNLMYILPIVMTVTIGLFIYYVKLKYRDWKIYLKLLERERRKMPKQLRDDERDAGPPF